ncbi:MAG: methyltransferase domain-containing protein [Pyrinomonadaceae bacterium]
MRKLSRPLVDSLPDELRTALSGVSFEIKTLRITKRSRSAFDRLNDQANLKLNLGCGTDVKPGWVNIDLALESPPVFDPNSLPATIFINHDLRRGIPLAKESCEVIYSSHFFEHVEYREALKLMRECYQLLKPGGIFRISLPDFKSACAAYLRNDRGYFDLVDVDLFLPEVEPGTLALIDFINFAAYQSGEHKRVFDEEKIILLLQKIGYRSAEVSSFQSEIDAPGEVRTRYSFYVEAIK